jgi:hypothetical protein
LKRCYIDYQLLSKSTLCIERIIRRDTNKRAVIIAFIGFVKESGGA